MRVVVGPSEIPDLDRLRAAFTRLAGQIDEVSTAPATPTGHVHDSYPWTRPSARSRV